jgi:hypothetical protein
VQAVWPQAAEPHVREFYLRWNWWTMRPAAREAALRQAVNVSVNLLRGDRGAILVLRGIGPGARLVMRPPGPVDGELFDPMTGETLAAPSYRGPAFEVWEIGVPADREILLLALAFEPAPVP